MKNKSLFVQIISLIVLAVVCILLTAVIFDFENLNYNKSSLFEYIVSLLILSAADAIFKKIMPKTIFLEKI